MKFKLLIALLLGGASLASAQGFKDAVQYYRADQPEEAEIIINRVMDEPSTDKSSAMYYLGQIAFQRGDLAAAKNYFEQGKKLNSSNGYNYVGLGEIALKNGDKAGAEALFKQAKQLDKKNAVLVADIARAYYVVDPTKYAKEIDKNIADAKKIEKDCPAVYILQADMLAADNKIGDSVGFYEMAMRSKNKADHPEAFVKYARTYFSVAPEYAIDGLKQLLEITPNSALAQRELAEKYYENNQLTRAAEEYGKYIQNPNSFQKDEQRYVGLLYFGKRYDESKALANKILSKDPENFYMKRMVFYNDAALENNNAALDAAEKFFAAKGDFNANDYTNYGNLLQKVGQDSLAVVQFEKAVALNPDKAALYNDLSAGYTAVGRYGEAAEAMQKYIDLGEPSLNDRLMLARRYMNAAATSEIGSAVRDQYAAKAVETINDVYDKATNKGPVEMTRLRILIIANNNESSPEIVQNMERILADLDQDPANAVNRKSDYTFMLNQLGKYYLDQKQTDKAKAAYLRFLEIDPSNEPLAKFVETLK